MEYLMLKCNFIDYVYNKNIYLKRTFQNVAYYSYKEVLSTV